MRQTPDHYQVLGVQPFATQEQIKAGYRRQALRHHPDKNPGSVEAAERFMLCNDAHAVLSDIGKRAAYDRTLQGSGVGRIVGSFVDDLLGTRRRFKRNGRDVRSNMEISLEEAASGVSRRIRFAVLQVCRACRGSGASPGGSKPCPSCAGRGELRDRETLLALPRPCSRCGGQGIAIVTPCDTCGAVGTVERTREFEVRLPPGITDGEVKVLAGEGEPGHEGGRAGDLHITVRVLEHPLFRQQGDDVLVEIPLSFALAALGGAVEVATLRDRVWMKIPPGTQSGRIFRLRGKGIPRARGGYGDQLVRVVVETPVDLGPEQTELIDQLQRSLTCEMEPMRRDYESKVRAREGS